MEPIDEDLLTVMEARYSDAIRRDLVGKYSLETKYFETDNEVIDYYDDIQDADLQKFRRINFNTRKLKLLKDENYDFITTDTQVRD